MTLIFENTSINPGGSSEDYYTKEEMDTALAGKANVATTLAGYGITDGANTSLCNLNSNGQMIIDSQNGTISNCVLEIPQNIKLELSNNVLTLKAGSVLTKTGETYATVTTTTDQTHTIPNTLPDDKYYIMSSNGGFWMPSVEVEYSVTATTGRHVRSGDTLPATGDANHDLFYLTTDKSIYFWSNSANEWQNRTTSNNACYPLCIIEMKSGVASFAKDSNGNYMIFNGAGFIGQHVFVYPGIKMLSPMGLDDDGNLNSEQTVTSSLTIAALGGRTSICCYNSTTLATRTYLGEYKTVEEAPTNISTGIPVVYISGENKSYQFANNQWSTNNSQQRATVLVNYSNSGSIVTDFTIRQPVRTATVEMVDKKQDILTFDSTPTQNSTNPVTSGGVYTALSGKQADITTITGYDATKTQTLKNVSGVLTWVDD